MQKYYEILGLSQGASQGEIKKAYFRLVREYSPEKHPEEFREIREAYEVLKDAEELGPSFPIPEDPWAVRFLRLIREYEKKCDFVMFRNACEEALNLFPEEIQFQYLLAVAQRKAGNTGKAVKTSEALVKKDPGNKWYWRELALACIERGFTRKAFPYIMKAFEMGCVDNDFLLVSSIACNEMGEDEAGVKLLLALVEKDKRWKREEIPEILEAYMGLFIMRIHTEAGLGECFRLFLEFLRQYSMYLEENMDVLLTIITTVSFLTTEKKEYDEDLNKIIQMIQSFCHSSESQELFAVFQTEMLLNRIYKDERLGDTIKGGVQAYFDMKLDHELRTFAELDMKLCMLKERNEILPQLEILEKEYLVFYEKIRDFAEKLKSDKIMGYKDAMQRQYASLTQYVGGGRYFELYPEEKIRSFGRVVYESDELQPYVREEKKIGRNDPCPCGSGRKYKHCCIKKG